MTTTQTDPISGATDLSSEYKLNEIALNTSLVTLDSELQAKYFASVAAGESLLMHITNWSHNQLFVSPSGSGDINCVLARPLSRLDTIMTSFSPELTQTEIQKGLNYATMFWASDDPARNCQENFEIQYQLGPSRYPDDQFVVTRKFFTAIWRPWALRTQHSLWALTMTALEALILQACWMSPRCPECALLVRI